MSKLIIALIVTLFQSLNYSQDSNLIINSYVKKVDLLVKTNKLTIKEYPNMSFCGGALTGFYQSGVLIYIKSVYGGAMGATFTSYYLKDDKLLYTYENHSEYIPPKDFDSYCEKHKDKNGNCDFSALKQTQEVFKTYFLQIPKVFHSIDTKTINLNSKEIEAYILKTTNCLTSLIEELNEIP